MRRRIVTINVPAMQLFRERAGLSLRSLKVRTGISASTLQRIEQGNCDPRLSTCEKIAFALGVTIKDLWDFGVQTYRNSDASSVTTEKHVP